MLQLFMNELSTPLGQCSANEAVARLKNFCGVVRRASSLDKRMILNMEIPLAQMSFGPDWPLPILRNLHGCVEESIYLKTVRDRAPFSVAFGELGGADDVEYQLPDNAEASPGTVALALGLAHQLEGLAVSLPSHAAWSVPEIGLHRIKLSAEGDLVTDAVIARNASEPDHVDHHAQSLVTGPEVESGVALWSRREELFPNLEFIPRTRAQIETLLSGDPQLPAIVERLSGINIAVGTWRVANTGYPTFPFNVRPESRTRQNLARFNDANLVERVFSDHADFAPGEGRIHFIVMSDPRRHALIGHVGRKLGIG
ncbi:hypothetical protein [Aminobacter sp. Piv2-1]|uniref:hypothetical protein n=1 Tax=Aminobacter sp. Piv2-1 TaxID=3031122 RepID=UPI0030A8EB9D